MYKKIIFLSLALLLGGNACAANPVLENGYMKVYRASDSFAEVHEFLELAITEKGMKINNVSHIGKMLERTRGAVGSDTTIYSAAKALEFCSAVVSREMMEADPHNIVFCPYIIYVYQLAGDDKTVYVAYRKPWVDDETRAAALVPVTGLLESIIGEVIE